MLHLKTKQKLYTNYTQLSVHALSILVNCYNAYKAKGKQTVTINSINTVPYAYAKRCVQRAIKAHNKRVLISVAYLTNLKGLLNVLAKQLKKRLK